MKGHQLLFTRTTYTDYRWILVPSYITSDELQQIVRLFSHFTKEYFRQYQKADTPLFVLRFSGCLVVIQLRNTFLADKGNRDIYACEGISVELEQESHLKPVLPALLTTHRDKLNLLDTLPFETLDETYTTPTSAPVQLDLPVSNQSSPQTVNSSSIPLVINHSQIAQTIQQFRRVPRMALHITPSFIHYLPPVDVIVLTPDHHLSNAQQESLKKIHSTSTENLQTVWQKIILYFKRLLRLS